MEEEECRAEERQEPGKEDSAGWETDAGVTEERECRVGDRDKSRGGGGNESARGDRGRSLRERRL